MASSGPGMAAGGLDPSRNGDGFGLTPTACSETSGGVSAPAPDQAPAAAAAAKNPASGPAPGQPGWKKRRPSSNESNIAAPPQPDLDGVPGFWRRAPSGHQTGTLAHALGSAGYSFTSAGNQSWPIDEATARTYASDQRLRAPDNPAAARAALATRKEPRDTEAHHRALARGKQPRDAALHAAANGYGKAPRSDVAAAEPPSAIERFLATAPVAGFIDYLNTGGRLLRDMPIGTRGDHPIGTRLKRTRSGNKHRKKFDYGIVMYMRDFGIEYTVLWMRDEAVLDPEYYSIDEEWHRLASYKNALVPTTAADTRTWRSRSGPCAVQWT